VHVTFPIHKKREELARVRFAIEDCEAYVDALLKEAPHLAQQVQSLQSQLKAAAEQAASEPVPIAASEQGEERRLEYLAADLLQHDKGFVWCAKCQRELKAAGTVFERYERGRGRLDGGGGRRFFCGSGMHLLLEVVDWRS
jgi:hypothetical protein